ncbi:hypothetical protein QJU43_02245 [Pasteurella atlantica]|uniref:Uncharacterized protein n=2 Tax=Pasteurellaceae TaxID=712 RepID=A0ACC6HKG6_9PAST|nr:DUF6678 family protein [Pasteurella atlantica]MDP8033112.1 hypothetical protein [Pasteurella atlantica]MDP8035049.1 hypothetical protein [Pasteurella atlantica]MDP8036991.1 hypothetical protein [Pasteurella atlantica]MDP8047483.1 hypothetical protein [Pasteurella atlantica]MDP8049152.1 hypothetical protein [Pasteurella atlantica]
MNTPFDKILKVIELYEQEPFKVKFRIQTKPNVEEYKHYVKGSHWNEWISNPTSEYIDFGLEPTPYKAIKQIQINPIEEKEIGKLMPSKLINHTKSVCKFLTELKINYEIEDVLICIK